MLRIVVSGPGPEALARALRDAGHEVVVTGSLPSAEQVVATALQEDADLVGLTDVDPGHVRRVAALLAERDADDVAVFATVADDEEPAPGGPQRFAPGTTTGEVVAWVAAQERPPQG